MTNGDNTVQPLLDSVSGLIIRQHSFTQSAPLLRFQDPLGVDLSSFGAGGAIVGGALSVTSITSPGAGVSSEQFGAGASAAGAFGTAVGNTATAAANSSVAIGWGSTASNGGGAIAIGAGASANQAGGIAIGAGAVSNLAHTLVIGSSVGFGASITAAYIGSGIVDTAPANTVLHATGGSGANVAGGDLTLAGGQSTGSSKGGDLLFQTSPAGGAGSAVNALATILRLTGDSKIGVFGTTPVVKQAGASAGGIAAVLDANAAAALAAIQAALAAYGLVTSPV